MVNESAPDIGRAVDLEYLLAKAESCLQNSPPDIDLARECIRKWLVQLSGEDQDSSIADVLRTLAGQRNRDTRYASVMLRCLAVKNLLPENDSSNNISRSIVLLSEQSLPNLCQFLKIDPKQQTYEKLSILENAHNAACEILNPIRDTYGDLDSLINAKRNMLGALAHSTVRNYCSAFKLTEIKSTIEAIFAKLKQVTLQTPSLLIDYQDCKRAIEATRSAIPEMGTFLAYDFLQPLLLNADDVLTKYLESMRARFSTKITTTNGTLVQTLNKKYPLHEKDRELQIIFPLKNSGPGMATDVRVVAVSDVPDIYVSDAPIFLGNVSPGELSVIVDVGVMVPVTSFSTLMSVSWGEIGSVIRQEELLSFTVSSQAGGIDWNSKTYWAPYSTDVAEGEEFVGRDERIRHIASKVLRSPMEPFYITGQKRVGKTSLVKAAAEFAQMEDARGNIEVRYILWGAVAHADAKESMQALGHEIEDFLFQSFPTGISFPRGSYDGSLAYIIKLANFAERVLPNKKYFIVIDEFDEIHQELYLYGNLAETLFANIRAISRCKNICFSLVGGENMPYIMDRQGQKLNNFSRINLSYYSRATEWEDFRLLVRRPTEGILIWHDEAVSEIFNVSNGNPYFAKIVCAQATRAAVEERDADISAREVRQALEKEVSLLGANFFSHMWRDGIAKPMNEQEPDILRRMRVFVAMARCMRRGLTCSPNNILEQRSSSALSSNELFACLHDFVRRDVLSEKMGEYSIVLPIFKMWLMDVGASQLISDSMSEEIANAALAEENAAVVKSEEIVNLIKNWPTYRGKRIGSDEVRSWLSQVSNPKDQRRLFSILKRIKFFSEIQVRERLRTAHSMIRRNLPEFVIRKRNERRSDIILTYVDGAGKSGASYASLYAEENGISSDCVVSPDNFRLSYDAHVKKYGPPAAVIIADDIAATGNSLSESIHEFLGYNGNILERMKIFVCSLVGTKDAEKRILESFSDYDCDIHYRACEILGDEAFAFPNDKSGWISEDECERAKSLCTDLGSKIYKNRPLGYGNQGLLVVFPTTVPNNSLPILHSYATASSNETWEPLFERPNN